MIPQQYIFKVERSLRTMAKIKFLEWMALIPTIFMILILVFLWWATGFRTILGYLLVIMILLGIYISSYVFGPKIFEYGETELKDDEELLKLEKDHAALLWAFSNGAGITFLLSGLSKISQNPLEAIIGLVLLIGGQLIYEMFYLPRYAFLIRKRKISLDTKK